MPKPFTALFSYFTGNGEDGLHLAHSRDGYRWEALNGGESLLRPTVGETPLMRDPFLFLGPDETFHLLWTTAWNGTEIGYASSRDLKTWSPQRALPVMAHEPTTLNCWAPEAVWDAAAEQFVVFWSSTIPGRFSATANQSEETYNHRLYATTTADFTTFTPTRLWYDPGFSVIDASFVRRESDKQWFLIVKDETLKPVARKHLRIAHAATPLGPFTDLGDPFTANWVEGPSALRVGNEYLVYFDGYREHRYGATRSRDLVHWEDVSEQVSFPIGTRHGAALMVEAGVVERLSG